MSLTEGDASVMEAKGGHGEMANVKGVTKKILKRPLNY
jgi:hypothetical protein